MYDGNPVTLNRLVSLSNRSICKRLTAIGYWPFDWLRDRARYVYDGNPVTLNRLVSLSNHSICIALAAIAY